MARRLDWEQASRQEAAHRIPPSGGNLRPTLPATERQLGYIRSLAIQAGEPAPAIRTRAEASLAITRLKAQVRSS